MRSTWVSVKKTLHELLYILPAKQKKHAVWVMVVIILGSGFELLGVSAVLPFLQAIMTPDIIMNSKYIQPITRIFKIDTASDVLILVGIGLILVYISKNVFMIFSAYVNCDYSTKVQKELSIKMLQSYMSRPYIFFMNADTGEIIRGCNDDIGGVYNILINLFIIISEMLSTVMIGVYIIYMEPMTAILAILLIFMVMIGIVAGFKPLMKRLGKKYMEAQAKKNKAIYQTINGVKELYAMQRQKLFVAGYDAASETVRKTQRNYEFINSSPDRIVEGICLSGLIGIVLVRLLMGIEMDAFVPKLGAFAMAAFKLLPSIGKISNRITSIVYYIPRLDCVYNNILEAQEYETRMAEERKKRNGEAKVDAEVVFRDVVSLKNVIWKYENQVKPVLNGISIDIHKGQSVALIGASGSGKTTLSDVILGLLLPVQGGVYMDGKDIFTMPKEWANIVGYVPQSVFLIDDTVRNNIAFGLKDIDDSAIWKALDQAQLKDFVEGLPDGLNTVVGEHGIKFSGGQRQRIAIARALFNRPEILILDEATAALDNETEKAVMDAINALQGHITMIIVAHRLTTIRNCDAIYEITDGKAVKRSKEEVFGSI